MREKLMRALALMPDETIDIIKKAKSEGTCMQTLAFLAAMADNGINDDMEMLIVILHMVVVYANDIDTITKVIDEYGDITVKEALFNKLCESIDDEELKKVYETMKADLVKSKKKNEDTSEPNDDDDDTVVIDQSED